MARASATAPSSAGRSHPRVLLELAVHPERALPRLAAKQGALSLLGFPAVSGVVFAYLVARGLALGDRFGFTAVAIAVVAGGAVLGIIALWFAGSLPNWSAPLSGEEEEETRRMFALFSNATWPFLPALLIMAPLELAFHGTGVFSAGRTGAPAVVTVATHAALAAAILLWLVMMVRGTAFVRHESGARAARELLRWSAEMVAIAVLFLLILLASIAYW
jgi:hypothetical protein